MKRLLIGAAILVVVLAASVLILYTNLGLLIERGIERFGTRMLGTEVSVGEVVVQASERRATLTEFTIANPIGYSDGHALRVGEISAAVDVENFSIDKIIVHQPEVNVEVRGGSNNIRELAENADNYRVDETGDDAAAPRLSIRLIEIEAARATMVTDFSDKTYQFRLDSLRLQNLEGTQEEITRQVLDQLLRHIAREVATEVLKEKAREKAGEIGDRLKDLLEGDG